MKVTVHSFTWYDVNTNKTSRPSFKRTTEWIELTQGAEIIPATAQVVDESELNMHGAYDPLGKGERDAW